MIRTTSLDEACQELFAGYPLAARTVNNSGTIHSMVLMLVDSDDVRFFVLSYDCSAGTPVYSLYPWPTGDIVDIEADRSTPIPDVVMKAAVTRGVPLPRHGSIFGWTESEAITALVVIYTEYAPVRPLPRWTVMPLAGIPEPDWPPFTSKRLFGHWFWEYYRVGSIVSLDNLIAETPDTVFWVNTQKNLGSDCCAVARDVEGPEGHTLRRGRYVYSEALRSGKPIPSLTELLANTGKTDLAARFQRPGHSNG
jgi:hypothetical protein